MSRPLRGHKVSKLVEAVLSTLRTAPSCPGSRGFTTTFENGLAAACLRGQGISCSGPTTISSLSFRMFMLVFLVCHVLNYGYAENNNNDDNNKKKRQQWGSGVPWCPVLVSFCVGVLGCDALE